MAATETSLAATLRVWRDRLTPAELGLPVGHGRRATGLRREELADLAGLSVDYVVRLEQGRATAPSPQVVGALARALRLTRAERDHLYALSGLQPPGDALISDHIPPGVQRLLAQLDDHAVAVFAADWRVVWWNRTWAALVGDPSPLAPELRSFARERFPVAGRVAGVRAWPTKTSDPDETDRAIVADLRQASGRYPHDPRLTGLLDELIAGNERFAALWRSGAVGEHLGDRKTITHPLVGEVVVDCEALTVPGADLKIVTQTAPAGSEDATKIELARIAGVAG
jgi:transcriptional regulator with XRE-family HTH domain